MLPYITRRILSIIPVLLAVSTITFFLMHLVPGGPWDREKPLAPQVVENLNRRYGLDKPLWRQYGEFLLNAARGDLGVSYTYQDESVTKLILRGLPITATLGLLALSMAIVFGLVLGIFGALRQNSPIDYFSVFFATIFASIPGFVLGILLIVTFSVMLRWLPTTGWGRPEQMIMPALALAALPAALFARISRASMLEVLSQDYIRTARAKGLAQRVIIYRHVLKNGLIPVITIIGPEAAFLITGSFIIENLFSIPGMGRLFVQGVFARDYGLIMGSVLFYTFVVALANLAVDLFYAVLDPRISYR